MDADKITCADCGTIIEENLGSEVVFPCPDCGSNKRIVEVTITESIKVYDSLRAQHKDPSRKSKDKIRVDSFTGYERSHSLKRMVKKERLIDKNKDIYYEHVTDPENNETINFCEESLSKHRGHGNAKKKP